MLDSESDIGDLPVPRIRSVAPAACAAAVILSFDAAAATIHRESADGDLSGNRSAPTVPSVKAGSNDCFGATTGAGGVDRDYATFVVPVGHAFTGLTVLSGTDTSGGVSFIGLQSGAEVTVNPASPTPALLLGWLHYGTHSIGHNILPDMGAEAGSIGFPGPLPAGTYSLWIQDFGPTRAPYGFRIEISPVPEPRVWILITGGAAVLGGWRRQGASFPLRKADPPGPT